MLRETVYKTQVVFPASLIRAIDAVSGTRKRSQFLVAAAQEKLDRIRFERALQLCAGAWKKENHPELMRPRGVETMVRNLRKEWGERTKRWKKRREVT